MSAAGTDPFIAGRPAHLTPISPPTPELGGEISVIAIQRCVCEGICFFEWYR